MDPKFFPDRSYPDGTIWGPDDECEEREIIKNLSPEYHEVFRAVAGFGERRVVIVKEMDSYNLAIVYWDSDTKGHVIEDWDFASELDALRKAHRLLGIEFEPWRFGYAEAGTNEEAEEDDEEEETEGEPGNDD
jgi:hypothetical protein